MVRCRLFVAFGFLYETSSPRNGADDEKACAPLRGVDVCRLCPDRSIFQSRMKTAKRTVTAYLPTRIRTPAAMARIAQTTLRLARAGTNALRPSTISQIASKSIPRFFVMFMLFISLCEDCDL